MKKMTVAVLGDPKLCATICAAIQGAQPFAPTEALEPLDEFAARRWFSRNEPDGAFICLGLDRGKTVNERLLRLQGSLNILNAAVGFTDRIRLLGHTMANDLSALADLCDLYAAEKGVDCFAVIQRTMCLETFIRRSVLSMHVSAAEENTGVPESAFQGGEMRDAALPQSSGAQQYRSFSATLLEVPVAAVQEAPRGCLRAEHPTPECQDAQNPIQDHAARV